jgi:glucose/arabinose dehydrogenase
MRTPILSPLMAILFFLLSVLPACSAEKGRVPQPVEDKIITNPPRIKVQEWVRGLEVPWSLVFLPDGRALVSERPGRIRLIKQGRLIRTPYMVVQVAAVGEGGLMGLALHPDFANNHLIYAMHTYKKDGKLFNRIVRLKDEGERGVFDRVIFEGIPGGRFHDGGRIAFGPDGLLYICAGETFKAELAQDLRSLAGKILRLTPEGNIPPGNPFLGSPIYSYGNRNPQGLAWEPKTKALFESEHGPSGEFGRFANDEINVIQKGGNYGWPRVIGMADPKTKNGFIDPIILWKTTTPPSGITFYTESLLPYKGDLFVATLGSECLIKIKFKKYGESFSATDIQRWFARSMDTGLYGRLRDVVQGPDGALYFLTNNTDGRGTPRPGDDKIYCIMPQ